MSSPLSICILFLTATLLASSCKDEPLTSKLLGETVDVLGKRYQPFRVIGSGVPLYMRMSEVSVAEYCVFLDSIKYSRPPVNVISFQFVEGDKLIGVARGKGYGDCFLVEHSDSNIVRTGGKFFPGPKSNGEEAANCVTFYGAIAYCRWLSERIGASVDLPTEIEWHGFALALRDSDKEASGCPGDVWEWCLDRFDADHTFRFEKNYIPFSGENGRRVVRGGRYYNRRKATMFDRAGSLELSGGANEQGYGFRPVIRDLPPRKASTPKDN